MSEWTVAVDTKSLAWAAGLFEGEGSIDVRQRKPTHKKVITATVASTDEDVIDRLLAIFRVGAKSGPYRHRNPAHKPYWVWRVSAQSDVAAVLMTLYPLLGDRRQARAREAILAWRNAKNMNGKWKFCKRGHPLEGEHLYVNPTTGARQCRTCIVDGNRRRRAST